MKQLSTPLQRMLRVGKVIFPPPASPPPLVLRWLIRVPDTRYDRRAREDLPINQVPTTYLATSKKTSSLLLSADPEDGARTTDIAPSPALSARGHARLLIAHRLTGQPTHISSILFRTGAMVFGNMLRERIGEMNFNRK